MTVFHFCNTESLKASSVEDVFCLVRHLHAAMIADKIWEGTYVRITLRMQLMSPGAKMTRTLFNNLGPQKYSIPYPMTQT